VKQMCIMKQNSESRVMVFVDLRNILRGAKKVIPEHFRVDLEEMVEQIVGDRTLVAAYVFDGKPTEENKESGGNFHVCLQHLGFRLKVRGSYDPETNCQKEVDVAMATEMVFHAMSDHYDTAIIASGDRDFLPALEMIQQCGKTVEVASFRNNSSHAFVRAADVQHDLDKMSIIVACNPPEIEEEPVQDATDMELLDKPVEEAVAVIGGN